MNEPKSYALTWHIGAVKLRRYDKLLLSIAVCEYSKGVCFIAAFDPNAPMSMEAIKTLIVQNVCVGAMCEEAQHCLNIDCPKNKAVISAFMNYGIKTRKQLGNMHRNLEIIRKELEMKNAEPREIFYYSKPTFYHRKPRSKRRNP